jgi:hypothetical protein
MICESCGKEITIALWPFCPHEPLSERRPFKAWVDEHISTNGPVEITSLSQWNKLMRDNNSELRDGPRPGDISARRDKCEQMTREKQHAS